MDTLQNKDSIDSNVINNLQLTQSQNSYILKVVHQCISALVKNKTKHPSNGAHRLGYKINHKHPFSGANSSSQTASPDTKVLGQPARPDAKVLGQKERRFLSSQNFPGHSSKGFHCGSNLYVPLASHCAF